MALGEFELIERYFTRPVRRAALGVGDDCALLQLRPGMQLATSTDLLIEGRHFLSTVAPERLGHKALAVNLSDLAACGAEPLGFTLSLALPVADAAWLERFSQGLFALADAHGCELVGGDTTRGPLAVNVSIFGEVPTGQALLRSGARTGDDVYVSGTLGDARLALEAFRGGLVLPGDAFQRVRVALEQPQPRVALGLALRGLATSAIDVSDGLAGDLAHVLRRSGVGATLRLDALPRSEVLTAQPETWQRQCLLSGGDDYELLFTAPAHRRDAVQAAAESACVPVSRIGAIEPEPGLRLVDGRGHPVEWQLSGFDHFRT
ncbi:thiamine-phosphate kinase [Schlegelella sp. S2-27]|uniref:Thiamine-monophosphate kinase n=1 Tax=Caldimonas mangrovi TaxID=2944811 RepID=A0ABT0YLT8_9BURK|nr:thiamine-phosphate kinase [Caldimonas mangrovi]MCM5679202.1 thiamine-phosphate kinase [Caldimonas mangrovi]